MLLNLCSPINTVSYGYVGTYLLTELRKQGVEVSLFPIGPASPESWAETPVRWALQNARKPDFEAPCLRLWHQWDMSQMVGKGLHVGFPIFELDTLTDIEVHHLRGLDRVIVCSEWARGIVHKFLPDADVRLVPLGVDIGTFHPVLSPRQETIFLNVGKIEYRKGHDFIAECFNSAFSEKDNVELWMAWANTPTEDADIERFQQIYRDTPLGHKIKFIPRLPSQQHLARVMQQANVGLFPSRAEGFNLECLEMLSCGKQIIATDYSAHTEYLCADNATLIHVNNLERADDGKWFRGHGNWAYIGEPQKNQISASMRELHNTKQNRGLPLNENGIATAKSLTWSNMADKLLSELE